MRSADRPAIVQRTVGASTRSQLRDAQLAMVQGGVARQTHDLNSMMSLVDNRHKSQSFA
jgi:hypothetical protein